MAMVYWTPVGAKFQANDLNACRIGAQLMVDEVVEPKRAIQAAGAE